MVLGRRLGVGSSAVTRMVDALEIRKYVARCPAARDRRTTMIATTALGLRVIGDAEPLLRRATDSMLAGLEPSEVLQLTRTLRRLLGTTSRLVIRHE
jgi:DNA-binding MarR family transcriptional regulator